MEFRPLDALLKPRSAAIVGASPRRNVGGRIFRNMSRCGFNGPLFPVNPRYEIIDGVTCYQNIESLPEVPDCVAIAVPYEHVFEPLEAAAHRGVKAAVVVAEGFADSATDVGLKRQERLTHIASEYGMAISGPNCMGLVGMKVGLGAAFTNLPTDLDIGGVSLVSQSGGLLNAAVELGHNRGIGYNYLISGGNEAVITSADFIDWLADDPGTSVIMNILEGVQDGRRYREAIAHAVTKKPVVLLKLGRTDTGQSAALAHTGSLAGDNAAFEALAREFPVAMVRTIDEMIETAKLFDRVTLPAGDRVFLFSVSGGATVLAGDIARDAGLRLPPIGEETNRTLQEILQVEHPFQNPMDVVGAPRLANEDNLTRCLDTVLADGDFDVIAFVMVAQRFISENHQIMHDQYATVGMDAGKPIVMISEMNWQPANRPLIDAPYIAGTLEHGLTALKRLIDYAAYVNDSEKIDDVPTSPLAPALKIPQSGILTEYQTAELLTPMGLPFARHSLATTREQAVEIAYAIGFPVALKIVSPDIQHKTELGALRLGLASEEAVIAAYDAIIAQTIETLPAATIDGLMVQEMISSGLEVILGITQDPQFGPLVVVGAGGTLTELINDRVIGLPPLTHAKAHAMISELRCDKLLDGWRGSPPLDRDALIDALMTLSDIALQTDGQICAIDLNPVMVLPKGEGIKILDGLIIGVSANITSTL